MSRLWNTNTLWHSWAFNKSTTDTTRLVLRMATAAVVVVLAEILKMLS